MASSHPAGAVLNCAGRVLDLRSVQVMGILNVTPDSFSDGGTLFDGERLSADSLCRRAESMVNAGATVLDIGGESTRPGATPVTEAEELERVLPAVEAIAARFDVVISLDTSSPAVMTEGARLGAGLINDVRALGRPGALQAAVQTGLPVCLMHMAGEPDNMQDRPRYRSVTHEVAAFLTSRVDACLTAGMDAGQIVLDPGFGFGKTPAHNFTLLRELGQIVALGYPVLAGLSRKSMIAHVVDRAPDQRLSASLALAVLAANNGARLIRVHDVPETVDALAMVKAMETLA